MTFALSTSTAEQDTGVRKRAPPAARLHGARCSSALPGCRSWVLQPPLTGCDDNDDKLMCYQWAAIRARPDVDADLRVGLRCQPGAGLKTGCPAGCVHSQG